MIYSITNQCPVNKFQVKNTKVVTRTVAIPCLLPCFILFRGHFKYRRFKEWWLAFFLGECFCFGGFCFLIWGSILYLYLKKIKAICKGKKTLSMPKCLFFYHSTPTLATWGAQIRVGHQLIMPVAEPCKRLNSLAVGHIYIYKGIANSYWKKTSKSGYLYLAWYNLNFMGTVGDRLVTTGRSSHSD